MAKEKGLVVDGHNLFMRAIKASPLGLSATVNGEQIDTSGLLAFINLFRKYVVQEQPTHMVVCFDSGPSDRRIKIDSRYKESRGSVDPEEAARVTGTFDLVKDFLWYAGIPYDYRPRTEADDLVAAWVRGSDLQRIVILSSDKDFLQLLDERTTQIRPGVTPVEWNAALVREKLGCEPRHLRLVMALTGDKIDDVPGVPRIGHKTALKVLDEAGWSLNGLKEHPKTRDYMDLILRNFNLVNLLLVQPLGEIPRFNPSSMRPHRKREFVDFLNLYEMNSVAGRVLSGRLWKK